MSIYHGAVGTAIVLDSSTAIIANKPSWSLYKVAHVANTPASLVTYNTERSPSTNCTVNAGAGTVTITVPGKYLISWSGFATNNTDTIFSMSIRRNGIALVRNYSHKLSGEYKQESISCMSDLAVNDVIDVFVVNGNIHSNETASFSGFLI